MVFLTFNAERIAAAKQSIAPITKASMSADMKGLAIAFAKKVGPVRVLSVCGDKAEVTADPMP